MYQKWLVCICLISISNYVSAFYPFHQDENTPSQESFSTLKDRSEVTQERDVFPQRRDPTDASNPSLLKLDIHKVERRDNKFSKLISNTPSSPNALAISQDGSDYSYFSAMTFGSKSQQMYMLIDTGSANTWVFSSDCESSTCSIHNTFGAEDSTTLKTTSETWGLAYGTGEVEGIVATDTIAFANYTVTMGFGLATNASDDFNNYPMDGILGLGRQSSDQLGTPTVMEVLDNAYDLPHNILGVHLHRAVDGTKDGEIMFGGVDTSKFTGSISYTATANDDSWEIPVDDMLVNGAPSKFTGRTAIIDTGTTFILMPPSDAKTLHALIPGSSANGEMYTLPCSTTAKVQVSISGQVYDISPKDYVGKPVNTGSSTCSSTIIGHQAFGPTQWILGDVFLKNVYAVFDFDAKRIGFALPGSGGTANLSATNSSSSASSSSSSSPTATTASPSGSHSATSTGARTSSAHPASSSSGSSDSTVGGESNSQTNAAHSIVVGYWKVGFSLCLGLLIGVGSMA